MAILREWLTKAQQKKMWWKKFFFTCLAILVIINIFLKPHHPHFKAELIPGFWAIFGFGCTIILVKIAKGCAHTFLGKDEDFYERN
ncbi:hypothetical protein SAMN04488516_1186 [Desulfonauticus submarinus]|uniref:2TM domain-containing protein n=1 Tax=Desulfonauticus submarinus TaxID=206665 RepID=A0A1H0GF76_9BACT|nr:hypothetical protein [Desulfonauticus submarinus]SDO05550.1 hypothetical protein SAMN04488516_1186 [Desulfonauticus submarinus]